MFGPLADLALNWLKYEIDLGAILVSKTVRDLSTNSVPRRTATSVKEDPFAEGAILDSLVEERKRSPTRDLILGSRLSNSPEWKLGSCAGAWAQHALL